MTSPQKPARISPKSVIIFFVLWLGSGTAIFGTIVAIHPSLMSNQNILIFAYVIGLPVGALYLILVLLRARLHSDRLKATNNTSSFSNPSM
jgi:hypothetical protein